TLDAVVERGIQWLTGYQNAAYARRYAAAVEQVRAKESGLASGKGLRLTRAVAVNLAKLMAYKDEYEVARLYTDPAFTEKLRAQFAGEPGRDYRLHFHLAPPLLAKRNDKGELVKKKYGSWVMTVFKALARMKGLRGTALDVFGRTAERRQERQLIDDYLALINEFDACLTDGRLAVAIELANLPQDI